MSIAYRWAVFGLSLVVAVSCRKSDPQRQVGSDMADAGTRTSGIARTVVKGSEQPKCRSDADCPPHHGCACADGGCTFLPVSDADLGEPSAEFCIPLPTLWGGDLPPGIKDR